MCMRGIPPSDLMHRFEDLAALGADLHAQAVAQGVQLGLERVEGAALRGDVRDQDHAEQPGHDGLGDVQYVRVVFIEDAAHLRDDALPVRAQHADDHFFHFVHGMLLPFPMHRA